MFPPGRYGRRREPRRHGRLLTALVMIAVVAAGAALAVRLYSSTAIPAYDPQVLSYTGITDSR